MSLIWVENFVGQAFANDAAYEGKYFNADSMNSVTCATSVAFTGTNMVFMNNTADDFRLDFNSAQGSATSLVRVGVMFMMNEYMGITNKFDFIRFFSTTNEQFALQLTWNGGLRVIRQGVTLVAESDISPITLSCWHFLEAQFEVSDTTSQGILIHIDGEEVMNETAVDLVRTGGDPLVDNIEIVGITTGEYYLDHLWVQDMNAGEISGYDLTRVYTRWPNSDGAIGFDSVGGGTSSISALASSTPDDDTTYLHASVLDTVDFWSVSSLSAGDTVSETVAIHSVQLNCRVRRSDLTSDQEVELVYYNGTTCANCSVSALLDSTYSNVPVVFSAMPGGGAWEVSTFDTVSFGIALTKVA
jgi:hypothetical protein